MKKILNHYLYCWVPSSVGSSQTTSQYLIKHSNFSLKYQLSLTTMDTKKCLQNGSCNSQTQIMESWVVDLKQPSIC